MKEHLEVKAFKSSYLVTIWTEEKIMLCKEYSSEADELLITSNDAIAADLERIIDDYYNLYSKVISDNVFRELYKELERVYKNLPKNKDEQAEKIAMHETLFCVKSIKEISSNSIDNVIIGFNSVEQCNEIARKYNGFVIKIQRQIGTALYKSVWRKVILTPSQPLTWADNVYEYSIAVKLLG